MLTLKARNVIARAERSDGSPQYIGHKKSSSPEGGAQLFRIDRALISRFQRSLACQCVILGRCPRLLHCAPLALITSSASPKISAPAILCFIDKTGLQAC